MNDWRKTRIAKIPRVAPPPVYMYLFILHLFLSFVCVDDSTPMSYAFFFFPFLTENVLTLFLYSLHAGVYYSVGSRVEFPTRRSSHRVSRSRTVHPPVVRPAHLSVGRMKRSYYN
jgi:hypothetical protein